jgi:pimeloyl-ACP methyl ester carboxylesterase
VIDRWWETGEHVSAGGHAIFARRVGDGPHLTLLHGFPSSSYDWAAVAEDLAGDHALLLIDFLGFGASDKPADHEYSIHEQADIVESVWAHFGVDDTAILAHDYAVSVTQELLARGRTPRRVLFSNGGLYPDLHRPEPIQTALLDPVQGPQVSAAVTQELLTQAIAPTWGRRGDHTQASADIWRGFERDNGHQNMHRLIRYILDRREHERRWVDALEQTDVPLTFVWGLLDPVSGAHMLERIAERLPDARIDALEDVGHWPPLEAPERIVGAVRA